MYIYIYTYIMYIYIYIYIYIEIPDTLSSAQLELVVDEVDQLEEPP